MLTKSDLRLIKELLDEQKGDIDKEFKKLKEDIIRFKDEILHEIMDLRNDVTVITGY